MLTYCISVSALSSKINATFCWRAQQRSDWSAPKLSDNLWFFQTMFPTLHLDNSGHSLPRQFSDRMPHTRWFRYGTGYVTVPVAVQCTVPSKPVNLTKIYYPPKPYYTPCESRNMLSGTHYRARSRQMCLVIIWLVGSVGDPDPYPDPLVTGTGTDPDLSLFSLRCWADWNKACKIKFQH